MTGNLFILTGPSGVGKTSVAMQLLERRTNLKKVVTCTTRPMRDGETNGVDYHFFDHETFQQMIDADEMFEWDRHYDNLYGSRKSDVQTLRESGNDVLFVVDVQGAINIKETNPEAPVIFLEAENDQELINRLKKRDGGDTAGYEQRLEAIKKEMAYSERADHRIVNKHGALEQTMEQIMNLIDSLDANT